MHLQLFVLLLGISCIWGSNKFHEDLSEEDILDYFGVEARYNVPEYAVVSPQHVSKHKEFPVYSIKALGENYLLHLSPNHRLIAPGCVVHHEKANKTRHIYPCHSRGDNCHFHGTSVNHNLSKAAISTCHGLYGIITTRDHEVIVKPIKKEHLFHARREVSLQNPHLVYKKPIGMLQARTCGVTGLHNYVNNNKNKTRKRRQVSGVKYLEMALVADKHMFTYHGDNLRQYMLTVANIASARFTDATLRHQIIFTVVKLQILENDLPDLDITEEADTTLTNFCHWQEDYNEPDDNSPLHYDGISLLTRLDISHLGIKSNTGLGTVGGMCSPSARCTYCEDTGLDLGLTLAHETGHTLGMVHDGNDNYCDDGKYIMSGSGGGGPDSFLWSQCSANALTEFLGEENSYCLDDFPSGDSIDLPHDLPGIIYSADEQCHQFMGSGSRICTGTSLVEQFNNDECARLVCYDPQNDGQCIGSQSPRMDGSECGDRRWCIKGRCVPIGTKGPQPINGGWSEWDADWSECSRTCGRGVQTKARKCNNPSPRFGGLDCDGENLKAELCNKEDCTKSQYQFKEEQCTATDNEPLFGKTYQWLPYDIIGEEECFRYCQTSGNDGQIQLRTINNNENYTDGTICSGDFENAAFTRCVKGRCRSFSCDGILNNDRIFDACGICGGEGETCIQNSGTFKKGEKQKYVTFVKVPASSTGIYMINKQSAFTSMRIKVGDDILFNEFDGGSDDSGLFSKNGVKVKYTHRQREPELIEITGPIPVEIEAQVWMNFGNDFYNTKPDIYYEYYTPKEKINQPEYKWMTKSLGCTTTCGGGLEKIKALCIDKLNKTHVEDTRCSINDKPKSNGVVCNEQPCPASWIMGQFSDCTVTCDVGIKTRTVDCQQTINSTQVVVGADNCNGEKPADTETCNELACPGVWITDTWSQCSQTCGYGMKERNVSCIKNDTSKLEVADILCDFFTKPSTSEKCLQSSCFTNINKADCKDSSSCKGHKKVVCQNYKQWSLLNCPKLCGLCSNDTCVDKVDCLSYGKDVCTDYTQWSNMNCRKFCGICKNSSSLETVKETVLHSTTSSFVDLIQSSTCTDSLSTCLNYGKSVCKNYKQWAINNCQKYCGFCSGKKQTTQSAGEVILLARLTTAAVHKMARFHPLIHRYNTHSLLTTQNSLLTINRESSTKEPNCKDLTNCALFGENICTKYNTWAMKNCQRSCHFCSSKTEDICHDMLNCAAYGKEVCTVYKEWASQKCRQFCGLCSLSFKNLTERNISIITPKPGFTTQLDLISSKNILCEDKINCAKYGMSVCRYKKYQLWVKQNCKKFCGICALHKALPVKPKCKDAISNCHAYGKDVCKRYSDWSKLNCQQYCSMCFISTNQSTVNSHTNYDNTVVVTNSVTDKTNNITVDALKIMTVCEDKVDCKAYGKSVCKDYKQWSEVNCQKSCHFCGYVKVNSTCSDLIQCSGYGKSVCTKYTEWSKINCQKYCQLC